MAATQRACRRRLQELGADAAKRSCTRLRPTLHALWLTAVLALPWPGLLALVGWYMDNLSESEFVRSLSASQRLLGTDEIVVVMHEDCGLHGASEDAFARDLAADGILPTWRLGAFLDLESTLRDSLKHLRTRPELPARDHIRGFIFDPETGSLREVHE